MRSLAGLSVRATGGGPFGGVDHSEFRKRGRRLGGTQRHHGLGLKKRSFDESSSLSFVVSRVYFV